MARPVIERGGTYFGIDVSGPMIDAARAAHAGRADAEFRVGDVEALPVADASFDAVICMAVIEYLPASERALAEIARVLRPGGVAIVTVPTRINLESAMLALSAPVRAVLRALTRKERSGVRHFGQQPAELDRRAAEAGLTADGFSHYFFTPLAYPVDRLAPRLAMRVNLAFERLHRIRHPLVAFLAQGYVGRYRKVAGRV
jgi:SAM-dependent methyltransferase